MKLKQLVVRRFRGIRELNWTIDGSNHLPHWSRGLHEDDDPRRDRMGALSAVVAANVGHPLMDGDRLLAGFTEDEDLTTRLAPEPEITADVGRPL